MAADTAMVTKTAVSKPATNPRDLIAGAIKGISIAEALSVKVMPNPSTYHFTLVIAGGSKEAISLHVVDALGKVMEVRTNLAAGQTLQLGNNYRPGVYFVELVQGNTKTQLKLIKL